MRNLLMMFAAGFLAAGASAQSLRLVNASYPGIYCRFSANCEISPTEQSATFVPTNAAAACVLKSRTFPGTSMDSNGRYGYEYQIVLNNSGSANSSMGNNGATGTNSVAIDSLKLNFGEPLPFAFGEHASNQVWMVTIDGPVGAAPSSADMDGSNVVIHFDPPLVLDLQNDQSTNTAYFGMVAGSAPEITTAILSGTATDPVYGAVSFEAEVQTQTP
jgi:hypothetical protein